MNEVIAHSLFTDFDVDLFKSGKHYRLYEKFGSHITTIDGVKGTYFAVWAPTANQVLDQHRFRRNRSWHGPLTD